MRKRYPEIDIDGALVAVTGGARGIGLATARLLAQHGATVAIGDLVEGLAKERAAEIGGLGYGLDVASYESFEGFLAQAGRDAGRPLDVLVNNAGVMPSRAFLEQEPAVDRLTFDVNVYGVINGMRIALPGMIAHGRGHVVNVASLAGKFPLKGLAVYNASKFAVVGLTAATRLETARAGVSVSAVLPSAVDTELASGISFRPLPKTQPEKVAEGVLESIRTRKAELAVPKWVGRLQKSTTFAPEPVMLGIRWATRDDKMITKVDHAARRAYEERLARQQRKDQ